MWVPKTLSTQSDCNCQACVASLTSEIASIFIFEKRKTAVAVTTDGLLVIISKPPSFCEELTSSKVG